MPKGWRKNSAPSLKHADVNIKFKLFFINAFLLCNSHGPKAVLCLTAELVRTLREPSSFLAESFTQTLVLTWSPGQTWDCIYSNSRVGRAFSPPTRHSLRNDCGGLCSHEGDHGVTEAKAQLCDKETQQQSPVRHFFLGPQITRLFQSFMSTPRNPSRSQGLRQNTIGVLLIIYTLKYSIFISKTKFSTKSDHTLIFIKTKNLKSKTQKLAKQYYLGNRMWSYMFKCARVRYLSKCGRTCEYALVRYLSECNHTCVSVHVSGTYQKG